MFQAIGQYGDAPGIFDSQFGQRGRGLAAGTTRVERLAGKHAVTPRRLNVDSTCSPQLHVDFRLRVRRLRGRHGLAAPASLTLLGFALTGIGTATLGFLIFGALGLYFSDQPLFLRHAPEVINVMLLCAILIPMVQWFRLRFLESAGGRVSSLGYSVAMAFTAGVFASSVAQLAIALRRANPGTTAALGYVALFAAMILTQYVYYRWVQGWFGRVDLA